MLLLGSLASLAKALDDAPRKHVDRMGSKMRTVVRVVAGCKIRTQFGLHVGSVCKKPLSYKGEQPFGSCAAAVSQRMCGKNGWNNAAFRPQEMILSDDAFVISLCGSLPYLTLPYSMVVHMLAYVI